MANTFIDYNGNGSTTVFNYSFPVLDASHVVVKVDNVTKTYNVDYTVAYNASTQSGSVTMGSAPANGTKVRVQRVSAPNQNLVDFVNGARLTEANLDTAYLHTRYLSEESTEISDSALTSVSSGGTTFLDAANLEIQGVGAPTTNNSAATKTYVDTQDALKVTKASPEVTGALDMNNNRIHSLGQPIDPNHATTKTYVDTQVALQSTNLTSFKSFTYTGDGSQTVFNWTGGFTSQVTTAEAYIVSIDGTLQAPANYTIQNGSITFSAAPPNGSSISVVTAAGAATLNFPATTDGTDVTFSGAVSAATVSGQGLSCQNLDAGTISGSTIVNGTISGTTTFTGDKSFSNNVDITGTLDVTGVVDVNTLEATSLECPTISSTGNTLTINDNTVINGSLTLNGATAGDLVVGDDLTVTGNVTATGSIKSGAINVANLNRVQATNTSLYSNASSSFLNTNYGFLTSGQSYNSFTTTLDLLTITDFNVKSSTSTLHFDVFLNGLFKMPETRAYNSSSMTLLKWQLVSSGGHMTYKQGFLTSPFDFYSASNEQYITNPQFSIDLTNFIGNNTFILRLSRLGQAFSSGSLDYAINWERVWANGNIGVSARPCSMTLTEIPA